jgi:hypothetical protein
MFFLFLKFIMSFIVHFIDSLFLYLYHLLIIPIIILIDSLYLCFPSIDITSIIQATIFALNNSIFFASLSLLSPHTFFSSILSLIHASSFIKIPYFLPTIIIFLTHSFILYAIILMSIYFLLILNFMI